MALLRKILLLVCCICAQGFDDHQSSYFLTRQKQLVNLNLQSRVNYKHAQTRFVPGSQLTQASNFSFPTLNGMIKYPSNIFSNSSIIFHTWNPESAFLQALWHNLDYVKPIVLNSSSSVQYVLMSVTSEAKQDVTFMKVQIESVANQLLKTGFLSKKEALQALSRFHYVTSPVSELTPWVGELLHEWSCNDHNCGIDVIDITSNDFPGPLTVPRLDARYDWLPSPVSVFGNKSVDLQEGYSGCEPVNNVLGRVALVFARQCSFFKVVKTMQDSGAIGVLVIANETEHVQDMTCEGDECETQLKIPASMIDYTYAPVGAESKRINYSTHRADNFNFAIDRSGNLAELGWFLYPSGFFFAWQSQWFDYASKVKENLTVPATTFDILKNSPMQGANGSVAKVTLPPLSQLQPLGSLYVDLSLSCPGSRDVTCPHWDHTVQLFVCCGQTDNTCDMELTRWISPFRRRIGRWLTDITPLMPLLANGACTFALKTVPWAMTWMPSLSLRFVPTAHKPDSVPSTVLALYSPGATFDQKYNSNFKPINFTVPPDTKKVLLYAVITGHGSDENGCGEFCVSSHQFLINNKRLYNNTFTNAGTPLGCAEQVPNGVEPNEHGTWLYGRGGWCDGSDVKPWVVDVTADVSMTESNTILYFGLFRGRNPNPKQNPGIMTQYSYLSFYS